MATRQPKTPPKIHEAFDVKPEPPPQCVTGVGERGTEQGVPFTLDGAGRKFVAAPHPDAGKPW